MKLFSFICNKFNNTVHQQCQCIKKDLIRCKNNIKFKVKYVQSDKIKTIHCCGIHLRQLYNKPLLSVFVKRNNNTYVEYHNILITYDRYIPESFIRKHTQNMINTLNKLLNITFLKKNELDICTICLEPLGDNPKKLSCNHRFHLQCISQWYHTKKNCPVCRKTITSLDERVKPTRGSLYRYYPEYDVRQNPINRRRRRHRRSEGVSLPTLHQ